MYDPRKHNYFAKLMQYVEIHGIVPGQIREIDVCHDDWCRIYRGGYCNCDPEIRLHTPPQGSTEQG
jgi:hypothetical protein